jgi:hypothetical protein
MEFGKYLDSILNTLEWAARYGIIDIVFGLGIVGLVLRGLRRYIPRNLDNLHIHVQSQELHANDFHEQYDHVLGIFIANSGTTNVYIARAFFRPTYRVFLFFKRSTKLPIYSKAFKSAAHKAYEIKFGRQWYEYDVIIKPEQREFSYLPLSKSVDETIIKNRQCGTLVIEYATAGKSGIHVVRV